MTYRMPMSSYHTTCIITIISCCIITICCIMITINTFIMITINTFIIVITICCSVWNYVVDTENKFDFLYSNTNEAQRRDVIYGTYTKERETSHYFHFCH